MRRLAYEAADAGLLSPELAAGVRRVKGVKKLGVRLGIGSPQKKLVDSCSHLHPTLLKENAIVPLSLYC